LEQEVEKLNEQIKNQTKNLEQQQEGQKQLEQQVEKLENQIQTLAKEKQNLQEENESTISELSSEIKTLKETNTEQEKSSKIEGLEQEVEKLNEQIETFDKEKQNLQNRIKELESTINEIQDIEKLKVIVKNISIPIKLKENFTECSENDSVENLERLKERNQMLLEVLGEKNDEIESLKKQKENLINISTNTDGTKKKFEHTPDPTNDPTKYTLDSTKMSEANPFKPLNNKTNKPPPPPSSSKPKVTSNDLKRIVGIRTDETKKTLELSSSKPKGEIGFPLSSTSEANPFKSPTDK
ncbi:MAG: hypothetical protein LBJ32_00780, partial [Oscillospiraceae bacterium]|nr:hypothetical protein [Oscillospiraceae bacterium]